MAAKEAQARIRINKLLEEAGWRFFDDAQGKANVALPVPLFSTRPKCAFCAPTRCRPFTPYRRPRAKGKTAISSKRRDRQEHRLCGDPKPRRQDHPDTQRNGRSALPRPLSVRLCHAGHFFRSRRAADDHQLYQQQPRRYRLRGEFAEFHPLIAADELPRGKQYMPVFTSGQLIFDTADRSIYEVQDEQVLPSMFCRARSMR